MKKLWLGLSIAALTAFILGLAPGCGESAGGGDTQTNWLKRCTGSADCGGLECVCGRCAKSCTVASDCSGTPVTTSCDSSAGADALCENSAPQPVCLASCNGPSSCAESERCVGGSCVPGAAGLGDGGPTEAGTGSGSAADFCQRWLTEFSSFFEACGCGATAAESYRQQNAALCEPGGFFDSAIAAVAAGDLVYDASAADALFARLGEPDAECVEEPFRALGLDSLEVYSLAGTFTGTHALGTACSLPVGYKGGISDCAEGVCAPNQGGDGGLCVSFVGEGDGCDASGDEHFDSTTARICFKQRAADSDGEYESAFDSLSCVLPASGGAKVCARALTDGQDCDSDLACASGRCASVGVQMGVCSPKLADGGECSAGGDCQSGACRYDIVPNVCGALLADGTACVYEDSACQSGSCNDPDGSGGACGPAPSHALGESCTASYDCRDGVCHAGLCVADICADYLP